VSVAADCSGTVIADNNLVGNLATNTLGHPVGAARVLTTQLLGPQWDENAIAFDRPIGMRPPSPATGAAVAADTLLARIAPYTWRAYGYFCAGDDATAFGGTLNVQANTDTTRGAVIRGHGAGQSADLLAVQSHDGAQPYLRVAPGLTAVRPANSTQMSDVLTVESHDGAQSYLRVAPGKLGFFGKAPVAQPSVSTGTADAKVDSVIAALRTLGLIAP
jgi:hypothetical protein